MINKCTFFKSFNKAFKSDIIKNCAGNLAHIAEIISLNSLFPIPFHAPQKKIRPSAAVSVMKLS